MKNAFPLLAALAFAINAHGEVALPALFSDHSVLQKSARTPVWGTAAPGESVRVRLDGLQAETVADPQGRWRVNLNLAQCGPGPFTMEIEGQNHITVNDVVVGEVWLCAGQSNMEFPLARSTDAKAEIASSANPLLRQFHVGLSATARPGDDVKGGWKTASPENSGAFTAVGYYFGKQLQRELNAPVGLINSSWGGSCIEAWMSRSALAEDPLLKAGSDRVIQAFEAHKQFAQDYQRWEKRTHRENNKAAEIHAFATPDSQDHSWQEISLPGAYPDSAEFSGGAVWFFKTITVPPEAAGKPADLKLGDVRYEVAAYWNGHPFGSGGVERTTHRYGISGNLVQTGNATLALRVFNPAGRSEIREGRDFTIMLGSQRLPLSGTWQAKVEYELPALSEDTRASFPNPPPEAKFSMPSFTEQNIASYLYNGMIHPLIPYGIAGTVWYQGEQNLGNARQYGSELPLLIESWRATWGENFPFLICQLPNFGSHHPDQSAWAELRESQAKALALPRTGLAVLIDAGNADNIHPPDKRKPADRLSRTALSQVYGREIPWKGPTFVSKEQQDNAILVRFQNADGGLRTSDGHGNLSSKGDVSGFAVCGDDGKWQWARARIEGETVRVWCDAIPEIREVRYGWADNPECSLYNSEGLPAEPFRTDQFKGCTDSASYGKANAN